MVDRSWLSPRMKKMVEETIMRMLSDMKRKQFKEKMKLMKRSMKLKNYQRRGPLTSK